METTSNEVLGKSLIPKLSLKQILETYSHIDLTEDEMDQALISAKRLKEDKLKSERIKLIEEENRRRKSEKFDFMAISTFMMKRAENLFKGKFQLDSDNRIIFEMLCYYFNNDSMFLTMAEAYGVKNPSLDKGIFLAGNFGTGKSWMMRLFMQNKRQCFFIRESGKIALSYVQSKDKSIPEEYFSPFENSFDDPSVFYQKYSGLCIEDVGAENVKNNFGNVSNVIGDLIERRYSYTPTEDKPKLTGPMLHGNTNLSADELKSYYGERVVSRMREIFNWIKVKGEDRRK